MPYVFSTEFEEEEIQPWEFIDPPIYWKSANLNVIGDRHLPNGRRQHLVVELQGNLKEFDNADIIYKGEFDAKTRNQTNL